MLRIILLVFILGVIVGAIIPWHKISSFFKMPRLIFIRPKADDSSQQLDSSENFRLFAARLLGTLARADSAINKQEENAFQQYFFASFNPNNDQERQYLIETFKIGILEGRNITEKLANFYWQFSSRKSDLLELTKVALELTISDGAKNVTEGHVIEIMARTFGIHPKDLYRMEEKILNSFYDRMGYRQSRASSANSSQQTSNTNSQKSAKANTTMQSFALSKHYRALGLSLSSTRSEVKKAYRALVKNYHPDSSVAGRQDAGQRFRQIQEAYDALRKVGRG